MLDPEVKEVPTERRKYEYWMSSSLLLPTAEILFGCSGWHEELVKEEPWKGLMDHELVNPFHLYFLILWLRISYSQEIFTG